MEGLPASVTIDGARGEGGGQIVRTSLALSVLLGTELTLFNIRAGRARPGLQPQHLAGVRAAAAISQAEVDGAAVGSTGIRFIPRGLTPGEFLFDVAEERGSAGSVSLVFQTVVLPLAFAGAPSTLDLRGGTHVPMSPTANFVSEVFLRVLKPAGLDARLDLIRAGYYPPGGGQLAAAIQPTAGLEPLDLTRRGTVQRLTALVRTSNLPGQVSQRMVTRLEKRLNVRKLHVDAGEVPALSPNAWCLLIAEYKEGAVAGFSGVGALRKPAEKVVDEAVDAYEAFVRSGAGVDLHLADQLLLPLALAGGRSRFTTEEVTQHLLTNADVIRQFLPTCVIDVQGEKGRPGTVAVSGVGFMRPP